MESESEARGASARAAMLREYLTDPEHLLSVDQDGTRWAEVNVAEVLALLDALDAAEERLAAVRALAEQWATQEPQSDGFSEGQISSGDQILQLLGGNS